MFVLAKKKNFYDNRRYLKIHSVFFYITSPNIRILVILILENLAISLLVWERVLSQE